MKKLMCVLVIIFLVTGCNKDDKVKTEIKNNEKNELLLNYREALEIFKEDMDAIITDVETGISYKVKRVTGGFITLADVETVSKEDTVKLLETAGGAWNYKRRAVIVTINNINIAASIAPYPHSGREDKPYGISVDNRSGATGTGINLDSIRDNDLIGVVDIYFYNSITPIINRIDERHQEMVLKASEWEQN